MARSFRRTLMRRRVYWDVFGRATRREGTLEWAARKTTAPIRHFVRDTLELIAIVFAGIGYLMTTKAFWGVFAVITVLTYLARR